MVAGSTLIGLFVAPRWGTGPVDLLYLPAVLVAAIWCGTGPALLSALVGTLAYNFFFTAPHQTFFIHSPADIVTVAILFIVALVTSRLTTSMRDQAKLAHAHASRNALIAGLARRLLTCSGEPDIAQVAVEELSRLFHCDAVLVICSADPQILASSPFLARLNPSDSAAAMLALSSAEPAGRGLGYANHCDWQFHPIASGRIVPAAVGLARADGSLPVSHAQHALLLNLLDQVALAFDRARFETEAREFATSRERDKLRAALLASIGQDVRPRLNAISSAARALKRASLGDRSLISKIAAEASKLDRYVDHLVDLSPSSDQIPIEAGSVTIDLFQRTVSRDGAEVHLTPKEYAVLAELAKQRGRVLTHSHLLRTAWGPAHQNQVDYLRVAVSSLRKKLEQDPARPKLILNEPAVGYRLVASPSA
jgi:two-component system, OmpR family, sensor histidine kinase KdpD